MAKKQFKSESKRLLDLMINSIYTHKEIFLREIISNASDAIDKLCFISLTDDKVGLDRGDFKIVLKPDKESRTLTITDNGIGMNKDDLENNLGTIASSGSLKFKQSMEEKQDDIDIIGQFGVGFLLGIYGCKEDYRKHKEIRRGLRHIAGSQAVQTATQSARLKRKMPAQRLFLKSRITQTMKTMTNSLSSTEYRDLSRSIPTTSATDCYGYDKEQS